MVVLIVVVVVVVVGGIVVGVGDIAALLFLLLHSFVSELRS